jgi:hypothetical protein
MTSPPLDALDQRVAVHQACAALRFARPYEGLMHEPEMYLTRESRRLDNCKSHAVTPSLAMSLTKREHVAILAHRT